MPAPQQAGGQKAGPDKGGKSGTSGPPAALSSAAVKQPKKVRHATGRLGRPRSPKWCKVVQRILCDNIMTAKRKLKAPASKRMTRMSVGFPPELFRTLEQIADQQKVSVAWIVRDAAEKYVSDRWPLLAQKG